MSQKADGLKKLQGEIETTLEADGKEDYVEFEMDEDEPHLVIHLLTDDHGDVLLTTGDISSVLRSCYRLEGKENNIWISSYSPDHHAIIARNHPENR